MRDDGCEVCGAFSHETEDHEAYWPTSSEADEYAYYYDLYTS